MFYTKEELKSFIVDEKYIRIPGSAITVCALTVKNGFTFIGYSRSADPLKFDKKIGEDCSYEKAFEKVRECYAFLSKEIEYKNKLDDMGM